MKIYPEKLASTLAQPPLAPAYWLLGNDPLLKEESLIILVDHAKQQGFEERHRFNRFDSPNLEKLHYQNPIELKFEFINNRLNLFLSDHNLCKPK